MNQASTTSPFVNSKTEDLWVDWTDRVSLITINEKNTDGRFVNDFSNDKNKEQTDLNEVPTQKVMAFQRPQYTAVLNRMDAAKKKTGEFTSWTL